jgi:uncharacterized damage-inducible protein DinB
MNTKELNLLFQRDLTRLQEELQAYQNEENLWKVDGEIANSGGNLALHLIGNLRQFIAADLGGFGYERNREQEFVATGKSRTALLEELDLVKEQVEKSLVTLDPNKLGDLSIHSFFGYQMTIGYFLIHLYGHFNYHLGQINYHRRLLDS